MLAAARQQSCCFDAGLPPPLRYVAEIFAIISLRFAAAAIRHVFQRHICRYYVIA